MTDTKDTPQDDDGAAARERIAAVRAARERNGAPSLDEVDGDLGRTWVRMMLGRNRGEERGYRAFDEVLDRRLTLVPAGPLDKDY